MRKTIFAVLALAMLPTLAHAQELAGTLKKVKDSGQITLGYRESSVPFSYLDDNARPVGYAMDICYRIVDAVKAELKLDKLDVKLVPVTSSTRIPLMANGTVDLECGSTTNNAERQKQVWYTNTHFLTASAFIAKKSSNLLKIEDLKGKTVSSTSGTTNIKQLAELNAAKNLGMTILPAKDHAEGFLMVETGRADAFVMDDVLLASLAASSRNPGDYQMSQEDFFPPEPYGIMVRKGDTAFKAVADKATSALYRSGEGARLYDKWFLNPIPPKNINLNMPLSDKLKKAFEQPSDSPDPKDY